MEARMSMANLQSSPHVRRLVEQALEEDLASGDVTTQALIPPGLQGKGSLVVKGEGVLAGLPVAALVFQKVDESLRLHPLVDEGATVRKGDVVATVEGSVASILKGERVALNFLQRMSGIATETAKYVKDVEGLKVRILDTRKTTPGLRILEKYAVRAGGGHNHRLNLADGVLVKDNHIAALKRQGLALREIVRRVRQKAPQTLKVQVEVSSLADAQEAVEAGADALLLDNMPADAMRQTVAMVRGRALLEASGGVTLANVRQVAETGVDRISIGALTHSVKALDISLELE